MKFKTLDRRYESKTNAPYVLDGQQRLLALFAAFRSPGDRREVTDWFRNQDALRGVWFVDISEWLKKYEAEDGLSLDDADAIESVIGRNLDAELTAADSLRMIESELCVPLWLLLQQPGKEPESLSGWREAIAEGLARSKSPTQSKASLQLLLQHFDKVRNYRVPVTRLPELSMRRALSIFKRLNRTGCRLDGADLVCGQLTRFDPTIRADFRNLEVRLHKERAYRPLDGLLQEDMLDICLCVRHAEVGGRWSGRVEQKLDLTRKRDEVKLIRSAFDRLQHGDAVRCASEILQECGVLNRSRWPVAPASIALIASLVHQPMALNSFAFGTEKFRLRKWWWTRSLECAASGRASLEQLFKELTGLRRDPSWNGPEVPKRFTEVKPAILLDALGANKPVRRIVECLLRRRNPIDFAAGDISMDQDLDLHHLFPRYWGSQHDIDVDVVANLALIKPHTNRSLVGKKSPRAFAEEVCRGRDESEQARFWKSLADSHGVDRESFWSEDYHSFIAKRVNWLNIQLASVSGA